MSEKLKSVLKQLGILSAIFVGAAVMWALTVATYYISGVKPSYIVEKGGIVDDAFYALQRPLSVTILLFTVFGYGIATLILRKLEKYWDFFEGTWRYAASSGVAAVYTATAYAAASAIGLYFIGIVPSLRTKEDLLSILAQIFVVSLIAPICAGIYLALPEKENETKKLAGGTENKQYNSIPE